MKEKILLFSGGSRDNPPKALLEICSDFSTKESRTGRTVNYLLNLPVTPQNDLNTEAVMEAMRRGSVVRTKNILGKDIFLYSELFGIRFSIEIEEADSSRPWRISEHDGDEYIDYLDTPGITGGPYGRSIIRCKECIHNKRCSGLLKLESGAFWTAGGCLNGEKKV